MGLWCGSSRGIGLRGALRRLRAPSFWVGDGQVRGAWQGWALAEARQGGGWGWSPCCGFPPGQPQMQAPCPAHGRTSPEPGLPRRQPLQEASSNGPTWARCLPAGGPRPQGPRGRRARGAPCGSGRRPPPPRRCSAWRSSAPAPPTGPACEEPPPIRAPCVLDGEPHALVESPTTQAREPQVTTRNPTSSNRACPIQDGQSHAPCQGDLWQLHTPGQETPYSLQGAPHPQQQAPRSGLDSHIPVRASLITKSPHILLATPL